MYIVYTASNVMTHAAYKLTACIALHCWSVIHTHTVDIRL